MLLDHFEDPGAWVAGQGGRVLRDGSDLTDEELAEPSRLLGGVKVEADNDVPLVITMADAHRNAPKILDIPMGLDATGTRQEFD